MYLIQKYDFENKLWYLVSDNITNNNTYVNIILINFTQILWNKCIDYIVLVILSTLSHKFFYIKEIKRILL